MISVIVINKAVDPCCRKRSKVDEKTLKKMAHLSRLELTADESGHLAGELGKILNFFNQIEKIDTKGIEPLVTPIEMESIWREDEKKTDIKTEEILANAPSRAGNLFKVPPVV